MNERCAVPCHAVNRGQHGENVRLAIIDRCQNTQCITACCMKGSGATDRSECPRWPLFTTTDHCTVEGTWCKSGILNRFIWMYLPFQILRCCLQCFNSNLISCYWWILTDTAGKLENILVNIITAKDGANKWKSKYIFSSWLVSYVIIKMYSTLL